MPRKPLVERRVIENLEDPLRTITQLISMDNVLEVHVAGMPEGITIYRDGARVCIAKKDSIECISGLDEIKRVLEENIGFRVYKLIVYEEKTKQ